MDEYIKREDALDAVLFALVGTGLQSRALNAIHEVDTADVVPKSEVKRLENTYNRAIRKIDNKTITTICNAKQEVAREIFEEIEQWLGNYNGCRVITYEKFAELKKKYTQEK